MHLCFIAATIIIALIWGDWRHWQKYHTTMLFVVACNLLYNFVYHNHYLWQMKTVIATNYVVIEVLYTFIVFPLTAMLFLTGYPTTVKGQIFRNLKYIAIFAILESVYLKFGKIVYGYGWNFWWSVAWDIIMFPMWILHYKKPLFAYGASIIIVLTALFLFPVSLD